ncbi:MAG TPA: hypothetical protein VE712_03465 [Actinomycetota bacterium]|jgi:hypothetical protein|nr:hypothetical protein [Actinomycetota bacterium]
MEGTGNPDHPADGPGGDRLPSEQKTEERTEKETQHLDELVDKARDARERVERTGEHN